MIGIAPQLTNLNVKWDDSKMKVTIDFDFGGVDMSRLIYQSPDTPPLRLVITSSLPLQAETTSATNATNTSSTNSGETSSLESTTAQPHSFAVTGRIINLANSTTTDGHNNADEEFEDYEKLLADDVFSSTNSNGQNNSPASKKSSSNNPLSVKNLNNVLTKGRSNIGRGTEVENDEVEILSENEEGGPFAVFGGMDLSRLIYQATETPPLRSSVVFDEPPSELIDSSSSLPLQAETTTSSPPTTTNAAAITSTTNTPTTTSSGDSSRTDDSSSSTEATTSSFQERTTTQSSVTTTGSSGENLTTTTESDANNNTDEGFGDDEKSQLSDAISAMNGKSNPAKKLLSNPQSSSQKPSNNNFSTKGRSNSKGGSKVPTRTGRQEEEISANVETEDSSFEKVDPSGSIESGGGKGGEGSAGVKGGKTGRIVGGTKGGKVIRDGSSSRVPSFLPRSRRLRIRGDVDDHDSGSDLISSSRNQGTGFNNLRIRASSPSSESGRRKKKSASRSRNSNKNRSTSQSAEGQTEGGSRRSSRTRTSRKRVSEVRTWRLEPLPDNLDLGYSDIPVRASRLSHRIVLSPTSSASFFPASSSSSLTRDSSLH